ncbi:MAG: purQ [Planctomycetota bacterium]|nr:purQ [Planctomycetota bacterium]
MSPRALVLRAPGTNCDEETVVAWERAGASVQVGHIGRLLADPKMLDGFQTLTIPGGFSYGDDLGAGRIFASRLGTALSDALGRFRDRGGLVLGICNGFQVLVRAGLLPGGTHAGAVTLARNLSGKFEARWVKLRPLGSKTPFLADDEPIELPVAHGEGRFLTGDPSATEALDRAGQIVLKYVDDQNHPTSEYPSNPNGSSMAAAGVCDATGRVFGLMPHPERFVDPFHHPRWTRRGPRAEGDGLRIFRNAVKSLS